MGLLGEPTWGLKSICIPANTGTKGNPPGDQQSKEASKSNAKSSLTAQQLPAPPASRSHSLYSRAEALSGAMCMDKGRYRGTRAAGRSTSASLHEIPREHQAKPVPSGCTCSGSRLAVSQNRARTTQKARGETPPSIPMGETTPWALGSRDPSPCSTTGSRWMRQQSRGGAGVEGSLRQVSLPH